MVDMMSRWTVWIGLVSILLVNGGLQAAESGGIAPDREKLAAVQRGECQEALASWWGFSPEDSTDALQSALQSGVEKLTIDKQASPWVTRPLTIKSHMEIIFEEGVEIVAKRGDFKGKGDSLFTADRSEDVTIHGNGAVCRMWKEDYLGPDYTRAEWRHLMNLVAAKNFTIENITFANSGGDGIYVGAAYDGGCENITLRNVICDGNNRQGISIISVKGLYVENCVFKNTSGTMPMAGVDFEPNSPKEDLSGIVFKNCLFDNNASDGISFYMVQLDETSAPLDVTFENCVTRNNGSNGFAFVTPPAGEKDLKGEVRVKNCRFESDHGGIMIQSKGVNGNKLSFENVKLVNPAVLDEAKNNAFPIPIQIYSGVHDTEPVGAISFQNVEVIDPIDRKDFDYSDGSVDGLGVTDLTGSITVRRTEDGEVVKTITLNDDFLATNFPPLNPYRLTKVETQLGDYVPYGVVHPEIPFEKAAPGIRARNQGDFRIYAREGETVRFTLQEFPYGDCATDPVVPKWTTPSGEERDLEPVEFLGTRTYEIPIEETGVYKLWAEVNPHNFTFTDCNVPFTYWAEPYAMTIKCPGSFYFYVPEGTERFGVKLDTCAAEAFALEMIDPSGKSVWKNDYIDRTIIWTPEGESTPGIWTMRISDTSQKTLDDICLNFLGIPSQIATQKGSVFVKKP